MLLKYYVNYDILKYIHEYLISTCLRSPPSQLNQTAVQRARPVDATHCSGSARVGLAPTAQHQTELMALASRETSKHKSSFTDHVLLDGLMLTNITAFAMFM